MRHLVIAVMLIVLTITGFIRNDLWHEEGTIWLDTIAKSPNKARAYNELGLHAVQVNDHALALKAFTHALRISPYLAQAHINIGLAYEGLNQPEMAILAYQRATAMAPDDPTAYYNLGLLYYRTRNDRENALKMFLKARDLNPLEPDVHQNLGCLYRDMGKNDLALEEFRKYSMLK